MISNWILFFLKVLFEVLFLKVVFCVCFLNLNSILLLLSSLINYLLFYNFII